MGIRQERWIPEGITNPEDLTITEIYDFMEAKKRVEKAPLRKGILPGFYPYRASLITLEAVTLDLLQPCARYILEGKLEIIRMLRKELLKQGVDILNLTKDKAIIHYNWGERENCIISPPLVEQSVDDGGALVLVDGLHRVIIAQELKLPTVNAILIKNTACPLPVKPVTPDEIQLCDIVPPTERKRWFRFETPEAIFLWEAKNFERLRQGFAPGEPALSPDYYFYRNLESLTSPGK